MSEKSVTYVVEYSLEQDAWHIESLEQALEWNLSWCFQGPLKNDYKIIAIVGTHEEASNILRTLRTTVDKARSCMAEIVFYKITKNGIKQDQELNIYQLELFITVPKQQDLLAVRILSDSENQYNEYEEHQDNLIDYDVPLKVKIRFSHSGRLPSQTKFLMVKSNDVIGHGRILSAQESADL